MFGPGRTVSGPRSDDPLHITVLGATGYIGGRLVPALLEAGHRVRCVARTPSKLDERPWRDDVEVTRGDLLEPDTLDAALAGTDVVYYLVHSLGVQEGFEELERRSATNVADAAATHGVRQIVYLGGLGADDDRLSPHLRSRHEVGRLLAAGATPVTELRAALVLGSGSASFEMLRGLVEVLPVMVTPRWVQETVCQPIAVSDVIARLVTVAGRDDLAGIWEIGGADVVTYLDLMQIYSERTGLRRRIVARVPVLTPRLSARWVNLVTSLPGPIASQLVEGLQNDVVVTGRCLDDVVDLPVMTVPEAIDAAVSAVQDLDIPTRWTAPQTARYSEPSEWDPDWAGGTVLTDVRTAHIAADPERVMTEIRRLGGAEGWLGFQPLWAGRALIDEVIGGPGWRRGRRHPSELAVGDVVDVFTVERATPGHLRLRADMKMPGFGWLEWTVAADGDGTEMQQCARFVPSGLWGRVYWTALVPFHALIFGRMVRRLAERAERPDAGGEAGAEPHPALVMTMADHQRS